MSEERAIARLATPAVPGAPGSEEAPVRVPKALDGKAKAAVVVRLLLNEGADLPLDELPDDLQALLTQQMGKMGLVDRVTLASVVHEFADALDGVGLSFPNGLAGALSVLDGKISPQTAARLRKEAGVRQAGDPWKRLRALSVEDLAPMAQSESLEVAAVLLSKLDVEKAAALLGHLPGPLARRLTYAVSLTENVTPEAVDRIGLSLAAQLDQKPLTVFEDGPSARVGAILNQSMAATRDEMLSALDETDQQFAEAVRKAIFTFVHIPSRVAAREVGQVIRTVDQADLITALVAASGPEATDAERATAEFLLSNISSRMADGLREEMEERGKVRPREGEAAMATIVAAIRQLVATNEITLVVPEEDESD